MFWFAISPFFDLCIRLGLPQNNVMGIFSIPDIIIAMTLIVNAIALVNSYLTTFCSLSNNLWTETVPKVSSSIRNTNEADIETGKDNSRINFDKGRMTHNEMHRNVDAVDHVDSDVQIQNNTHNISYIQIDDNNKNCFREQTTNSSVDDSGVLITSATSLLPVAHNSTIAESKITTSLSIINNSMPNNLNTNTSTIGSSILRFNKLMNAIRRLSCLIVVWNIFFTFLMVFVFGD